MAPITTPIERDERKLDEALAWYENGTLSDDDRQWVEAMLEAHPERGAALGFDRALGAAFERKVAELPADIGWNRLIQKVRADAAAQSPGRALAAGTGGGAGSLLQRLGDWFAGLMTPQLGSALAVLFAVQTVAIGYLLTGKPAEQPVEYRSVGQQQRPVAVLRAFFDESVTEKALREALTANGATIVDGPNTLGEYWIAAPADRLESVGRALREAGVVASFVIDQRIESR